MQDFPWLVFYFPLAVIPLDVRYRNFFQMYCCWFVPGSAGEFHLYCLIVVMVWFNVCWRLVCSITRSNVSCSDTFIPIMSLILFRFYWQGHGRCAIRCA